MDASDRSGVLLGDWAWGTERRRGNGDTDSAVTEADGCAL
jgi:hypothetical protein